MPNPAIASPRQLLLPAASAPTSEPESLPWIHDGHVLNAAFAKLCAQGYPVGDADLTPPAAWGRNVVGTPLESSSAFAACHEIRNWMGGAHDGSGRPRN